MKLADGKPFLIHRERWSAVISTRSLKWMLRVFTLSLTLWAPLLYAGVGATSPITSMTATGDAGTILAINGIPTTDLVLGVTTFPNDLKHPAHPAENADNFDLNLVASADDQPYFTVRFAEPVMTVFVIENGGNDCGLMEALDESGMPVGALVYYCSHASLPVVYLTGYGQPAAGLFIRMTTPVFGLRFWPLPGTTMGFDPVSISASSRPTLQWQKNPETREDQIVWLNPQFILQQQSGVADDWTDLPDATSPYTVPIDGTHRYFRLRSASAE